MTTNIVGPDGKRIGQSRTTSYVGIPTLQVYVGKGSLVVLQAGGKLVMEPEPVYLVTFCEQLLRNGKPFLHLLALFEGPDLFRGFYLWDVDIEIDWRHFGAVNLDDFCRRMSWPLSVYVDRHEKRLIIRKVEKSLVSA